MRNKLIYFFIGVFALLFAISSCSVDPTYYSEVVPSTFYQTQDNVWQRFYRPFTHLRWYLTNNQVWRLEEFGTDEMCIPTRGSDWFSGGVYQMLHHHGFYDQMPYVYNAWYGYGMGAALVMDTYDEISGLDLSKYGFEKGTKESMQAQLQTLMAFFYLKGLDFFGGLPLYTTNNSEIKPRASALETFNFIDSLLTVSIPKLPKKTVLGSSENGSIHQAVGAALKARLYFNAISYIGQDKFSEAASICQDIIDGKYGDYDLDEDWTKTFGFSNETSKEIIWSLPSQNAVAQVDGGFFQDSMPYNFSQYLGGLQSSPSNNGNCLTPSRDPSGKLYTYKLGEPYEKLANGDIRKQLYVYEGNGNYKGMFVVGNLVNPLNSSWKCVGAREYKGKVLNIVDQVTLFSKLGSSQYPDVASLPSTIATGEENSGIRLMKVSPRPTQTDAKLFYNPDVPIIRLSEIYYMLAECKMRAGDSKGAAELINTVRKRYFVNGNDPNPVTISNLDKYRMLDEWMEEFIGEGRRRTDLIRWGCYTTENWWDHTADNDNHLNLFPIPSQIMSTNGKLKQNSGY